MKNHIYQALDARQTPQWADYLESLGWNMQTIGKTKLAIRKIPFFPASLIKIQHAFGPFPFAEIDIIAKKNQAVWTLIEPHTFGYNEQEFIKNGYKKSRMLLSHSATIKIDLTKKEDELFQSFSENARRNIKKAQQQNLDVRVIFMKDENNWKYFDVFYTLLKNLSRLKKFYIPSYDEYHKKMTAFKDTSLLAFAYEKDEPIAVVWFAGFDNVIAYFQTGITTRGYETLANYLLVWEGFLEAKKMGFTVFDFESIFDERFPKNFQRYKNYTEFKKRFHGDVVRYPNPWVKTYNRLGKVLYLCGTLS